MNNEKYSAARLKLLVKYLREFVGERSWFDFKSNDVAPEKFGAYLAGLSNAACLANQPFGYLVFGVDDATHDVVGTRFNPMTKKRNGELLVWWLKRNLSREIAFDVFSVTIDGKKVVLVEIEAAHGRPTVFAGNSYVRFGTTLTELRNCPDLERELYQHLSPDWSARTVHGLTVKDLDSEALVFARKQYAERQNKNASFAREIAAWSDEEFLDRAQLSINGSLTNAALILLGTRRTENWYAPFVARITWILFDHRDYRLDYEHYSPPFILVPDKIFGRIRNLTLRQLNADSVFPKTMKQYDVRVFREVLHNCIAHQDYTLQSSIVVSEFPQRLQIANAGAFLPGSVENVLAHPGRPPYYPNKHLCDVMAELGMIDTIGLGIRTIFGIQRDNGLPVLSYEIEKEPRSVAVTIPGLPEGSNWLLPEEQRKFNGSGEPITEPINSDVEKVSIGSGKVSIGSGKVSVGSEKVSIGPEKVSIGTEEPSIAREALKQRIEGRNISRPTYEHITALFDAFCLEVFSRAQIMKCTGLEITGAGKLLKTMLQLELLDKVIGHGKGKYRFRDFTNPVNPVEKGGAGHGQ